MESAAYGKKRGAAEAKFLWLTACEATITSQIMFAWKEHACPFQ